MSYYSNSYCSNNFRYAASGFPSSSSSRVPGKYGSTTDLDRSVSSSYSNLATTPSGSACSTLSYGAPAQYMSTYYTSPASSSNATTIIITKKIPNYTRPESAVGDARSASSYEKRLEVGDSASRRDTGSISSSRDRSSSRDYGCSAIGGSYQRSTEQPKSQSPARNRQQSAYDSGVLPQSGSISLNVTDAASELHFSQHYSQRDKREASQTRSSSEYSNQISRNQQSYDEFLRSPAATGASAASAASSVASATLAGGNNGHHDSTSNLNQVGSLSTENVYSASSAAAAAVKPSSTGHHNNNMNDVTATAVANIQLNLTDDLMTQVDYCINEVSKLFFFCCTEITQLKLSNLKKKSKY
jgi:hypothetical protein